MGWELRRRQDVASATSSVRSAIGTHAGSEAMPEEGAHIGETQVVRANPHGMLYSTKSFDPKRKALEWQFQCPCLRSHLSTYSERWQNGVGIAGCTQGLARG